MFCSVCIFHNQKMNVYLIYFPKSCETLKVSFEVETPRFAERGGLQMAIQELIRKETNSRIWKNLIRIQFEWDKIAE